MTGTMSYIQTKLALSNATLAKFEKYQEVRENVFKEEEKKLIEAKVAEKDFAESLLGKNWMINHNEVIGHYPPQYIIGKQPKEDKTQMVVYEDEFCKIELLELENVWNYSNPTGIFNLSLPDKMMRTKTYTNISYQAYKNYQLKTQREEEQRQSGVEPQQVETQQEDAPIEVREWIGGNRPGNVLMQLFMTSKFTS